VEALATEGEQRERRGAYRGCHAGDVTLGLRVREGLVGGSLLEAVGVRDLALALSRRGVAEQAEDGVLDLVRVVEVQGRADGLKELLVRVL
jgi:hypothetical protein